jgi:hypothetical protein
MVMAMGLVAAAVAPIAAAESQPPSGEAARVDQQAFGPLYRTASQLAIATQRSDMTRGGIESLVDRFAAEVSVAKPVTPAEVQMVALYTEALEAYRDGLRFRELRRFVDRPGNREALDALAAKYDVRPESRLSYTAAWESYQNVFPKIWAVGNVAATKAAALYDRQPGPGVLPHP